MSDPMHPDRPHDATGSTHVTNPRWEAWQRKGREADAQRVRAFTAAGIVTLIGFLLWGWRLP